MYIKSKKYTWFLIKIRRFSPFLTLPLLKSIITSCRFSSILIICFITWCISSVLGISNMSINGAHGVTNYPWWIKAAPARRPRWISADSAFWLALIPPFYLSFSFILIPPFIDTAFSLYITPTPYPILTLICPQPYPLPIPNLLFMINNTLWI